MMVEFLRRRLPFMVESAEKYGDIVFFKVGNERIYLFNHPDLIRDVLVTNQKNFVKSRALVRAKRVLGEGLLTSGGCDTSTILRRRSSRGSRCVPGHHSACEWKRR